MISDMTRAAMAAAMLATIGFGALASAQDALPAPPTFQEAAADADSWRPVDPERLILMDTTKGRILIETAPEFAPNHVARITQLVRQRFYDGIIFHRVIEGFMAQGGDPQGLGTGGSGTNIDEEFIIRRGVDMPVVELTDRRTNRSGFAAGMPVVTQVEALRALTADNAVETWITHCPGVTSMARADDPNSADSQFFLMRDFAEGLDRQYTGWGRVVSGLDVVRSLNVGTVNQTVGFQPDAMTRVRLVSDLPEEQRPQVYVMREDGPAFAALVDSLRDDYGNAPDACEFELPSVVENLES